MTTLGCRRGATLVLVLWIIVILGTIAAAVVPATRASTALASNFRAAAIARYAAESGVALAAETLRGHLAEPVDTARRRELLNQLHHAMQGHDSVALGEARLAVALVDVSARVDVNLAGEDGLATLFSYFVDPVQARRAAQAIRAAPELRSLDDLDLVAGVSRELAWKAAPYLTVDGDGTINRRTASDTVLAAAGGELRDEPSRILIVSRGWQDGHPLTHEIQAVYAVAGSELTLVRWRER